MTPFDIDLGMKCRNLTNTDNGLGMFETCYVWARLSDTRLIVKSRQDDGYMTEAAVVDFEYFIDGEWKTLDD